MLHDIIAVETELNRLDISQSTLCALTGIAAGSLSDIIRGVKKPGFEQEQAIYRALEGLDRLISAVKPLQLDFKKTLQLKQQIELLDAGRLQISVVVQEPRQEDEPHFYIFLGAQYFAGRRPTVLDRFEVITTPYSGKAICMTEDCVARVISALTKMGHHAQKVPCRVNNPDSSFDRFESVWGEPEQVQQ